MKVGRVAAHALRATCALFVVVAGVALAAAASFSEYESPVAQQVVRHAKSGEPFEFVAFGDIEGETVGFEDLVLRVGEDARPDFGVVLGDVAKRAVRARESYIEYFAALRRIRPDYPVFTVPGNHDRPDDGAIDEYSRAFGRLNWWFEHADCVFVGVDNSKGPLTDDARGVLQDAAVEAQAARRVFVFLHVPVFGDALEPGAKPQIQRLAAQRVLADIRTLLGVDVDAVVAGHAEHWYVETDERGTLHVCAGAEPGLGWPERSTPQIAAVFRVSDDNVSVQQVRVPYRRDVFAAVRHAAHLNLFHVLRRSLAPLPVWVAALSALALLAIVRPRRSVGGPPDASRVDVSPDSRQGAPVSAP